MISEQMKAEGWIEFTDSLKINPSGPKAKIMFADGFIPQGTYPLRNFRNCHRLTGEFQIIAYKPEGTSHDQ